MTHGFSFVLELERIPAIHVCRCGREFNLRELLDSHVEMENAK